MKIYALEAELNGPLAYMDGEYEVTGDYDGISTVHATLEGALARLDEWLDRNGIDREIAHAGQSEYDTFVGNDVDPDLLDGDILNWGINLKQVEI